MWGKRAHTFLFILPGKHSYSKFLTPCSELCTHIRHWKHVSLSEWGSICSSVTAFITSSIPLRLLICSTDGEQAVGYWPQELPNHTHAEWSQPPVSFSGAVKQVNIWPVRLIWKACLIFQQYQKGHSVWGQHSCDLCSAHAISSSCLQPSLPPVIVRGCHHENVWSHGGGTD